jgi:hypothetical protein
VKEAIHKQEWIVSKDSADTFRLLQSKEAEDSKLSSGTKSVPAQNLQATAKQRGFT